MSDYDINAHEERKHDLTLLKWCGFFILSSLVAIGFFAAQCSRPNGVSRDTLLRERTEAYERGKQSCLEVLAESEECHHAP